MNELPRAGMSRATTRGAEGLPRWRWTLAEFDRLVEVGILTEDDRVELIGGEIVPMAAKGNRHDAIKVALTEYLIDHRPSDMRVAVESGWSPAPDVYFEPDIRVYARQFGPRDVPVDQVRLLIEVSDTSLHFDLATKAGLYASLGVAEYWVVDAWSLTTHVHRSLSPGGYEQVTKVSATEALQPRLLETVSLQLSALDYGAGA
jgi:Uma2 family endonuclease